MINVHEFHQPLMVESVEEAADIRIEHPIHFSLRYGNIDGIEGVVWASAGAKAVAEAFEIYFVDC